MKYSIIIATLNEEQGIEKVINSIPKEIKNEAEIIVPDVSTDSTPEIAEKLGARVIRMREKGKGRQMREAVRQSRGEILIFMDGDATDPGEYIPRLLTKLENVNLALACRSERDFKDDDKKMKDAYLLTILFCRPLFWLIDFKASDPLAGFRALRRADWDKLDLKSDDFRIETEMNIKGMQHNFKVDEIQIPNLARAGGLMSSKLLADPSTSFKILYMVLIFFLFKKI